MSKILHKYSDNIKDMVRSVHISPANYKDPETVDDNWRVYLNVKRPETKGYYYKEFKSVYRNKVKIGLNRIKNHQDKVKHVEIIRDSVIEHIRTNEITVVLLLYGLEKAKVKYPFLFVEQHSEDKSFISIEKAFEDAYKFKEGKDYSVSFIRDIRSIKNRFLKHLKDDKLKSIKSLTFNQCIGFLNTISQGRANKTYNNNKKYISNYLAYFKSQRLIDENFMDDVEDLKTKNKKNKPFSESQLKKLWELLEDNEQLKFYCQHIYYLIRITTTIRLKCKDIIIDGEDLEIKTNSKKGFIDRVLTKTLADKYVNLDLTDRDKFIFGRNGLIEDWEAKEESRRQHYSDLFKPYKEQLGIDKENLRYYGLNSFRHNGHLNLYFSVIEKVKDRDDINPHEYACKILMQSTGKSSVAGVESYLRGISPRLRFDYGKYID